MNKVEMKQGKRIVDIKTIHIKSDYHFAHPGQVVDMPKEREK